jgi:small-conductance mechanosensitive channel
VKESFLSIIGQYVKPGKESKLLTQLLENNLLHGLGILIVIIILTIVVLWLVRIASETIDKRIVASTEDHDRRARLQTVLRATKSTIQGIVLIIAVLIGLGTIGVDIGPALAAAGILGLAVSLGAQTLIKDVIGGLTILLEDEYHVGDQVRIGSVIGEVEHITLRRTDVRDSEGRLFMVPNGEVRTVANESRNWALALVELNFSFDSDIEKVVGVLNGAQEKLAIDPQVKQYLLAAPEIFGWNAISEWSVVVRLSARVIVGKQAVVARPMRQYALKALHEAGIPVESYNRMIPKPSKK